MKHSIIIIITCLLITGGLGNCSKGSETPQALSQEPSQEIVFPYQGKIIFQSNMDGDNDIYLLSPKGLEKLTDNDFNDRFPLWSPDGSQIAYYADKEGNDDIFIMDINDQIPINITNSPDEETEPAWYPDGKSLAYTREAKKFLRKTGSLYRINIKTKKTEKIIRRFNRTHGISNISPWQPLITFTGKRLRGWDVAVYNMKTNKLAFLEEKGESCRARFSKDGKRLAYVSSSADGKGDIWIMDPDGSHKKRLMNRDETYDYFPSWSPDGQYIIFSSSKQHDHEGDWQLWVVEVKTGNCTLLYDSPGNDIFPDWK